MAAVAFRLREHRLMLAGGVLTQVVHPAVDLLSARLLNRVVIIAIKRHVLNSAEVRHALRIVKLL